MKLLYKTSLQYLTVAVMVLLFTGCLLYFWMQRKIVDEIYEQLDFEIALIKSEIEKGHPVSFPFVSIEKIDPSSDKQVLFGDTLIFDPVQQELEDYYYLTKVEDIKGEKVMIRVMTIYIGWKQYANMIFTIFLTVAGLLCFFGLLINYYSNKRTWSPFFSNMEMLRTFSVRSSDPIPWRDSTITEFSLLQHTLSEMTEKSRREYLTLREFTENASHEIQTPLSIMRSSLEKLSQHKVDKTMATIIVDTKTALDRLSKVNKKLLMLAKLENNFYVDKLPIQLNDLLAAKLDLMEDLFHQKRVRISTSFREKVIVKSDTYLIDTLIFNLLSNMLLHTPIEGKATISLTTRNLVFSNDGDPLPFPAERMFERFKKGSTDAKSNGLGLSIVRQICEVNGWKIKYHYLATQHHIAIDFLK